MDAPPIQYCRTVDGVNIAYLERGNGHPLIMLPNHPYSHVQLEWGPWYDELAESCRVIRYDGRGNGSSDREVGDLSIATLLRDLEAVIEALELPRAALMGISVSSGIAARYAALHPERVSRLILWSPIALEDQIRQPYFNALAAALQDDYELYAHMVGGIGYGWDEAEAMVNWVGDVLTQAASPAFVRSALGAMQHESLLDGLSTIETPTLVIGRRDNPFAPPDAVRRVASEFRNAEFVALDGRAHMPDAGDTDAVLRVLRDLLDGIDIASPGVERATAVAFRTILFTDVVASTPLLAQLKDERMRAIMRDHDAVLQAAVDEHGGRVVKTIGDAFMAEFSVPSFGIEAAIAIQRARHVSAVRRL